MKTTETSPHLKKARLITTEADGDAVFVRCTDAGRALTAEHGIEIAPRTVIRARARHHAPVRRRREDGPMGVLWVGVVFLCGDDYAEIADLGIEEMVAHMAQWDCGRETDVANTRTGAPWGSADRTYEVTVGGIRYVLAVNHSAGYASLNRRPLTHT